MLELVLDWFVKNEMLKKLANVVFSNDDVDLNDIDDIVAFFSDSMGLVATDVNNINFDDDTFGEFDPINIVFVRLTARCNIFKQRLACAKKIGKELLPIG